MSHQQPTSKVRLFRAREISRSLKSSGLKFLLACTSVLLMAPQVAAAENIVLSLGPLEFALSVEALRTFVDEGKVTGNLRDYARFLSDSQLESFRQSLSTRADIEPLSLSQFFYSYQGIKILERVGDIIRSRAGQTGFYALRSALILAADSPEGLTPIKFLETIPLNTIKIESLSGLQIFNELSDLIQISNNAIAAVEETAILETNQETSTVSEQLNPRGEFNYRKETLELRDLNRARNLPLDLYLPKTEQGREPLPLIVISHGLGSDRNSFAYLASFLASHGFAVAVPEHPGSSASQIQNLLEGLANDVTPPEEFINRPLDISFVLDHIAEQYPARINTQDVGILGQSFGAYTALAVAGAELDLSNLRQVCGQIDKSFNVSLFLQCLALEVPPEELRTNFRDSRITSAIAINPLTSALFGAKGMAEIKIPIMLVAGGNDPITPALPEQIRPFTWLNSPEKYLLLMRGGTHFSTLNESSGSIPVPSAAIGPDPKIGQNYIEQLGLLFFGDRQEQIQPPFGNLTSSYAASISQAEMPLSLISRLKGDRLDSFLRDR